MAMAAHHMDIDWPSLEAMIVQAADAISAARPGARRDILESYVKRLEKLEGIADSFKGVSKSFALQAGREIRIMVESEKISDEEAVWLSKDIARRIENELEYPGPDQGDGHPRDPRRRLREVSGRALLGRHRRRLSASASSIARIQQRLPPAPGLAARRHRRRCGGRRAGAQPPRGADLDALVEGVHFDRRVHAARRDRPPRAGRQPERPGGDGRRAAARAAVAGAARRPAASPTSTRSIDGLAALARAHRVARRRRQPHAHRRARSSSTSRSSARSSGARC